MKKLLFLVFILFFRFSFADAIDNIKERGYINIGILKNTIPFSYLDDKEQHQGIDIDIAKSIAKSLLGDENKIKFIAVEDIDRIPILKAKKADLVVANFTKTRSRARSVDFSNPYSQTGLGLVAKKDVNVSTVEDLKNKKIIVKKGTTAEKFFIDNYPDYELVSSESMNEMFSLLKENNGDVAVHDNILFWDWLKNNSNFEVKNPSISSDVDYIAIAVNKNEKNLLNYVNEHLKIMQNNGELYKIYKKTFEQFYDIGKVAEVIVLDN